MDPHDAIGLRNRQRDRVRLAAARRDGLGERLGNGAAGAAAGGGGLRDGLGGCRGVVAIHGLR